jgi:hypothetical protein
MKKIKTTLNLCVTELNGWWRTLTRKRQQQFMLCCFVGYTVLTAVIIVSICLKSNQELRLDHISYPMIRQGKDIMFKTDSINIIPKKNTYEREQK